MVPTLTGVIEPVEENMDKQIMVRVRKKGNYNRTSTQKRLSVEVAIALLDIPNQVSFFMIDPVLNTAPTVWLMVDYFIPI